MVWTTYKEKVKRLSQRIVEAQRPIRILDAIKWDPSVEQELKKGKFRHMPKIGPEEYARIEIGYEPKAKIEELEGIAKDTQLSLGADDSLGKLLCSIDGSHLIASRM